MIFSSCNTFVYYPYREIADIKMKYTVKSNKGRVLDKYLIQLLFDYYIYIALLKFVHYYKKY